MRVIKAAVIFMGVVIVAGTIAMIVALVQRGTTKPDTNNIDNAVVALPAGARVVRVTAAGKDLILLVDIGGRQRIVIIDRRSGAVRRRIHIETAP